MIYEMDESLGFEKMLNLNPAWRKFEGVRYFSFDGYGFFAVRPFRLGGVECHIAFESRGRVLSRYACLKFLEVLPRPVWAIIPIKKTSVVNLSKKIGFKYLGIHRFTDSSCDSFNHLMRID